MLFLSLSAYSHFYPHSYFTLYFVLASAFSPPLIHIQTTHALLDMSQSDGILVRPQITFVCTSLFTSTPSILALFFTLCTCVQCDKFTHLPATPFYTHFLLCCPSKLLLCLSICYTFQPRNRKPSFYNFTHFAIPSYTRSLHYAMCYIPQPQSFHLDLLLCVLLQCTILSSRNTTLSFFCLVSYFLFCCVYVSLCFDTYALVPVAAKKKKDLFTLYLSSPALPLIHKYCSIPISQKFCLTIIA